MPVVRSVVASVIHRMHPLYFAAVCGAPEFRHPATSGVPTCIACAVWQPAPLRPASRCEKHWPIEHVHVKAGDSFEVKGSNARMVAVEDVLIVAVERYDDVLYVVDLHDRRWPLDLPMPRET